MNSPLAVQSYTIRDYTTTQPDFIDSIQKISQIGYQAIQLSAVGAMNGAAPAVSATQARAILDDHNIQCIATHRSWDDLVSKTEEEIAFHKALGCSYIALGSLPGTYRSEGLVGCQKWLDQAEPVIDRLKAEGIQFGYHNHAFEFEVSGPHRQSVYDLLLDAHRFNLMLELDVYWAAFAGINPERLVEKASGRLPVVHVKDMEVIGDGPVMAPVGEGNLDWAHLVPALKAAGTEWLCVEQDTCRRDPFDCLRSSFDYLTSLLN